jgi:hypothetical protein
MTWIISNVWIWDKFMILKIWVMIIRCIFNVGDILLILDAWRNATNSQVVGQKIIVVGVHWQMKCVEEKKKR